MRTTPALSFVLALGLQLARGVVGVLAIVAALQIAGAHTALSAAAAVALGLLALVAWRGCPTCWLMGLFAVFDSGSASCPVPRPRRGRREASSARLPPPGPARP